MHKSTNEPGPSASAGKAYDGKDKHKKDFTKDRTKDKTTTHCPVVTIQEIEDHTVNYPQVYGCLQLSKFVKEVKGGNLSNAGNLSHGQLGHGGHGILASKRLTITLPRPRHSQGTSSASIDCGSEVMALRYSPDGQMIAAGCSNGAVKVIHADTGECLHTLIDHEHIGMKMPTTAVAFPPTNSSSHPEASQYITIGYANGLIKQWHLPDTDSPDEEPEILATIDEARSTLNGTYSTFYRNQFLTCGADPVIYLYDMTTGQRIATMKASLSRECMDGHKTRVFAIQYHPTEPHLFLSGGWDDTVQFWDDRQPHSYKMLYGPHICGDGIDIDPKKNQILTSSWRKEDALQIWDFRSAKKLKSVSRDMLHDSLPYCGQWFCNNFILIGGCDDNTLRVIDRQSLLTVGDLSQLPAGVYSIDHYGDIIIAGAGTHIWKTKHLNAKMPPTH